jgi:hypothetical protein
MIIIILGIQFQVVYKPNWSHHYPNFQTMQSQKVYLSNNSWYNVCLTMWWLQSVFDYLSIGQMSINYVVT